MSNDVALEPGELVAVGGEVEDLMSLLDQSAVRTTEEEEVELDIPPVTDLVEAESAMGRVAVCRMNIERFKQVAKMIKARADALVEAEEKKISQASAALQPFVERIVKKNLAIDKKATKSIKFLMGGKSGLRGGRESIEVTDEAKAIRTCEKKGIAVKKVETVVKKNVLDYFKNTEGVDVKVTKLDGIKYHKPRDSFFITT